MMLFSADDLSLILSVKLSDGKIRSIASNPSKSEAIVSGGDGTLRIFDLPSLKEVNRIDADAFSVNRKGKMRSRLNNYQKHATGNSNCHG